MRLLKKRSLYVEFVQWFFCTHPEVFRKYATCVVMSADGHGLQIVDSLSDETARRLLNEIHEEYKTTGPGHSMI